MRDDEILPLEQRSTASKADSAEKSASSMPGQATMLSQPSWQTTGSLPTTRTRRRKRASSPGARRIWSQTSSGAGMTRSSSTRVVKPLPCSRRDAAIERSLSPEAWTNPGSDTKVPRPRSWTSRPSSTRAPIARRTVPRLRPCSCMSSCSDGMRAPGAHSREAIIARMRSESCRWSAAVEPRSSSAWVAPAAAVVAASKPSHSARVASGPAAAGCVAGAENVVGVGSAAAPRVSPWFMPWGMRPPSCAYSLARDPFGRGRDRTCGRLRERRKQVHD